MSAASLLRQTLEEMANRASVPMDVWDRHSNAALQAADRIEALEAEGVEVTLTGEHVLSAFRFAPGRYRIVKLDGPAPEPKF